MASIDRLTPLFERFRVRTRLFHNGPLCGVTDFAEEGRGFLHILRRGELEMTVSHENGHTEVDNVRCGRPILADRLFEVVLIQLLLGYSTPSAFSRVFTQRMGRSPRAWLSAA